MSTTLDRTPACHNRVAHKLLPVKIEIVRTVLDEGIQFPEGAFIQ